MSNYYISSENSYELYHYGILGMKWGVRRYQNDDGTLTKAGKMRYFKQKHPISSKDLRDGVSPRKVKKSLNSMERQNARLIAETISPAEEKYQRALKKQRRLSKGGNREKYLESVGEREKLEKDIDAKLKNVKVSRKKIDDFVEKVNKSGNYIVSSKDTTRWVVTGEDFLTSVASVGLGTLVAATTPMPVIPIVGFHHDVPGKKHKVTYS